MRKLVLFCFVIAVLCYLLGAILAWINLLIDWDEYLKFLEEKKISKICEFRGETCIDFNEELLAAIVNTLKNSINDTNKSIKYNSKKIAINRVING